MISSNRQNLINVGSPPIKGDFCLDLLFQVIEKHLHHLIAFSHRSRCCLRSLYKAKAHVGLLSFGNPNLLSDEILEAFFNLQYLILAHSLGRCTLSFRSFSCLTLRWLRWFVVFIIILVELAFIHRSKSTVITSSDWYSFTELWLILLILFGTRSIKYSQHRLVILLLCHWHEPAWKGTSVKSIRREWTITT